MRIRAEARLLSRVTGSIVGEGGGILDVIESVADSGVPLAAGVRTRVDREEGRIAERGAVEDACNGASPGTSLLIQGCALGERSVLECKMGQ